MSLAVGFRLGPYEILSPLGAGGMGEVYKARDTRLERTVAIKVLPQHLSSSPEVRQRFEREAKTISSLSHPHICGLYDVGHQDGTDFLVMEFVEGETLTERLARGQLPLEQALRYGIEIADALDAAHRQGVVHRDLKPGNVMLTKSGVKLVDFGLAKFAAAGPAASLISATALPTQAPDLTAEGTILGTFQYMAPEQLEGKEADARTDIFALGAVLYEMATGQRAFTGGSRASLIGAILHTQPPLISTIQPMTPPALDRVVRTCLAKDPEDRWRTAHDVRLELKWIAEGGSQVGLPAPMAASRKSRERLLWMALAILALAALLPWVIRDRKVARANAVVTRFAVFPPDNASFLGGDFDSITISPDGRRLALLATSGGRRRIWIRALDSLTAEPLPTEGAAYPFWSPDSKSIGFFADGKLKRIEMSGGPVQTLCDAPDGRGGTWNRDGVILFGRQIGELSRVSSSGGVPVSVTRLEPSRQESAHRWPIFLPDGRRFLYLASVSTRSAGNAIYVGSLGSKEATRLLSVDSNVAYSPSGYLLFVRDHTLVAQRFDAESLRLAGEVVPVADRMPQSLGFSHSPFSVSENGVLAYWTGDTNKELVWFDRAGSRLGSLGGASDVPAPSFSPDEKRVALARPDARSGGSDIWLVDVSRGVSSRLTRDRFEERFPIWSPDGTRIAFTSNRKGPEDLYQKQSAGTGREEVLYESDVAHKHALDWSRDGRFILYHTRQPRTGSDVMALPLFGSREPIPILSTEFDERHAQFSPDGRHVAYASDESDVSEIYVQPFPGPGEKLQISTQGGVEPRWRRDGREMFYVAPDGRMMAVPLSSRSGSWSADKPRALFQTTIRPEAITAPFDYAVTADGQRFLIATSTSETLVFPATVVLNWAAKLDR